MNPKKGLFRHECGSENVVKAHLALCLQTRNADASHTQNLAKLAWLRRPRLCISIGKPFAFALWRGLRHGYVSPSPCSSRSLCDRDALPFNLLMRNFKRNSACHEQQRRSICVLNRLFDPHLCPKPQKDAPVAEAVNVDEAQKHPLVRFHADNYAWWDDSASI